MPALCELCELTYYARNNACTIAASLISADSECTHQLALIARLVLRLRVGG